MALPRVDFIINNYNQLIEDKGYHLFHCRSMPCPCISISTGTPDPNCTQCENGTQYWGEEMIKGLITGTTNEKQYADSGGFMLGTMQLTVNSGVRLGYHDRIIHTESIIPYAELMTRGTLDKLRYTPLEVDRVIDSAWNEYAIGEDFELDGKNIEWVDGCGPATGTRYSVAYTCNPVWLVLSFLHLVRDTVVKEGLPVETSKRLPIQALCKLEFLIVEQGE